MSLNTPENLELLRNVIKAKVQYWDASLLLEKALCGEGNEYPGDHQEIEEFISIMAAGLDDDRTGFITADHLAEVIKLSEIQ
jgi:hypothetical protein